MKLSLETNLLPKTHIAGDYADYFIYEYKPCTLADGNNQRRMEMEPVSRNLGDYRFDLIIRLITAYLLAHT